MENKTLCSIGPADEWSTENLRGRQVLRIEGTQPQTGVRITLTFPADAGSDLSGFKQRLIRLALAKRQHTRRKP